MNVTIELTDDQVATIAAAAKKSAPLRVGEMRRHPYARTLYAVWGGARWFVFGEGSREDGPPTMHAAGSVEHFGGLTIEEWDEYR